MFLCFVINYFAQNSSFFYCFDVSKGMQEEQRVDSVGGGGGDGDGWRRRNSCTINSFKM